MILHKLFFNLAGAVLFFAGLFATPHLSRASADAVWLEGLVLTKSGRVAQNADITIRNSEGDKVMDATTNESGYFVLTELPITDEVYTVVAKHGDSTYRFSMLIDDAGRLNHHAVLFRLADTESAAIDLDDEYTFYRAGMRTTESKGKIVYLETRTPETDYPYTELYSYNIGNGKVSYMNDLMEQIGHVQRNGLDFSGNGRHVVAAYSQELKIWQVTTLDRRLKRTLDDNEYFSSSDSLLPDYDIEWLDNECVRAAIYQADSEADDTVERDFLEYRTYCI